MRRCSTRSHAGRRRRRSRVLGGVAACGRNSRRRSRQFPERRPFAAFDGDPETTWLADRNLISRQHWVEVRFRRPTDVGHVDLLPYGDSRGRPARVEVAGRRFTLHRGWNRLPTRLRAARSLRIEIVKAAIPARAAPLGRPRRASARSVSRACACPSGCARRCWPSAPLARADLARNASATCSSAPPRPTRSAPATGRRAAVRAPARQPRRRGRAGAPGRAAGGAQLRRRRAVSA